MMPPTSSRAPRRCAALAAGCAVLLAGAVGRTAGDAQPAAAGPGRAVPAAGGPTAHAVASGLAAFGPRPAGSPAKVLAATWLREQMRRAGLAGVQAVDVPGVAGTQNLEGVIPGVRGGGEVVLAAHYDTVPGSPGAGDDASGCGVAIAAAAELGRTPLRHTVRVVLFDGEEAGLHGSRAFVARLGDAGRRRVLAALNLEMLGWSDSPGATILAWGVPRGGALVQPPAWLAHALLRAGAAVGWPLAMTDPTLSLPAQLLVRSTRPAFGTDADSFLRAGVPAVSLSDSPLLALDPAYHRPADTASRLDSARLAAWTRATAAAVRRLDGLAGRPVDEQAYLVAFGRVWQHRDLLWVGFVLWGVLVVQGFVGRRAGRPAGAPAPEPEAAAEPAADPEGLRAGHRRIFASFPFRLVLLFAVVMDAVFALLLWPAAALALAVPRRRGRRLLWMGLALLPAAIYGAVLVWAWSKGLVGRWAPPLPGIPLVAAALAAFAYMLSRASSSTARSHSSSVV